jgi:tetratricopeptide (TPR) repeat protein
MGEYTLRVKSALWHHAGERHEQAVRLFEEANEVDPFRRDLHEAWGKSLLALKRFEEAEREFSMTLAVPVNLDPDHCIFLGNPGELRPGATLGTLPSAERKRLGGPEQWRLEPVTDLQRMELLLLQEECALAQGELERAAQLRKAADALVPNGK